MLGLRQVAASVGPSTSFYREGIVQHGQSPSSHGCLLSLGLELLPGLQTKLSLFCLYITSHSPRGTLYIQSQLLLPEEKPLYLCQVF